MTDKWFKRRKFGWGWTPVTWQGWLTIGMLIFGLFYFDKLYERVIIIIVFIIANFLKGETPRWSWGK